MKKPDTELLLSQIVDLSSRLRDAERVIQEKELLLKEIRAERKRPSIALFSTEQLINLANFLALSVREILDEKSNYVN